MITCPECKGEGEIPILPFKSGVYTITCTRCEGAKEVSDQTPVWMENGDILKMRRIDKRIILRKACEILNMDVVVLSKMERGCIEPDMDINYDYIPFLNEERLAGNRDLGTFRVKGKKE